MPPKEPDNQAVAAHERDRHREDAVRIERERAANKPDETQHGPEQPKPDKAQEHAPRAGHQDTGTGRVDTGQRRDDGRRVAPASAEHPIASMRIMGPDADPCAEFTYTPGGEQDPVTAKVVQREGEWLVLDGTEPAPRCTGFKTAMTVAMDAFRARVNNIL